jgi:hypothetical protein
LSPFLDYVVHYHASRSILWSILRCLPEPEDDESREVALSTFAKEFAASQTRRTCDQLLDYYFDFSRPAHYPHHLSPDWITRCGNIANLFYHKLKRMWRIYPKVNRTKNVSQESANLYLLNRPYTKTPFEVRTVDLEVLYAEDNVQVEGACEMRSSWKFNELKPRFYYAQGGRDYFASRYIKPLAVALMDSIPSTMTSTRINPSRNIGCDDDDYIVTWDLSAFTSSLHELRFFLYWMARAIEDRGDVELELVDYRHGLVTIPASELLLSYNETVNINSPFSIHRIIAKYGLEDFQDIEYEQQNSGMLGVAGNIGFSTALHGYTIESVSEQGKNVSVGDDALSCRPDDPHEYLFPEINKIGDLHPDKSSMILPNYEGPMKFVKRRLERTSCGFHIDFLLKLPLPVFIDERYGGRSPPDMSWIELTKKVATTIGQLVWSLTDHYDELSTHDFTLLSRFLGMFYTHFGLRHMGSLPDQHQLKKDGSSYRLGFAYPPIIFDQEFSPFQTDWLEFLLDQDYKSFSIPVMANSFLPELPMAGDHFFAAQDKAWKMQEDLGILKELGVLTTVISKLEGENRRKYVRYMRGRTDELLCYEYLCVVDVPVKFHFLYAPVSVIDYGEVITGI